MERIPGGVTFAAAGEGRLTVKVGSFADWRNAARSLLAQQVAPDRLHWTEAASEGDLFTAQMLTEPSQPTSVAIPHDSASAINAAAISVPRAMMSLLETAACHQSPQRWGILYVILWRWHHGERQVLSAADPDGGQLQAMVKAVQREVHDMHAYVRFRERAEDAGAPRFVAWFEPTHHVLPQVAQHFARRMGRVSWMIATPDATVLWDGERMHHTGALLKKAAEIDDAGEALWLTYYRSIFNPARLNVPVMHGHLPTRFWKNLPEGAIVPQMIAEAAAGARRVGQTRSVGQRDGHVIAIAAETAQPQRSAPGSLDQCRRCELWQRATQAVAGVGPATARIMLVGEQPGDTEDIAGIPFIGPAGQLLDRALAEAGLDRATLYLTNAVKHFKWEEGRGKRRLHKTPGKGEVTACRHWLDEELAQVQPTVVVALGSTALTSLMGTGVALTENVGTPLMHGGRWVIPAWHPSYVLRLPDRAAADKAFSAIVNALKCARRVVDVGLE